MDLTEEQKIEYAKTLAEVKWDLPGMEQFSDNQRQVLIRCIQGGDIVNSIHCLGWALWPTQNKGYYDTEHLRMIATFLEVQNKPFWDEYEAYCAAQEPLTEQEQEEQLCLDELGFTVTPTSTTETSVVSSVNPE